ncbi:MAG: YfhO family protein [bacterium]
MFNKKDISILLILIGVTLLFFARVLVTDFTFGYGDIHRYFYPIRYFSASAIKEGIIPFWNPYLFAGIPNLAALQPAVFYPMSILTYIFPFFFGIKLFIISHFTLASIFTYLLMRNFNISRTGSLISSVTYGFGGFVLSVVDMLTTLSAATWTPLILLFYTKALTNKHNIYLMLTGLFLAVQFLAGEPTQLYGSLIMLVLFWLFQPQPLKKWIFQGITPWVICIGLVLFQILPFLEMGLFSTRTGGVKFTHATSLSLGPHELLNLVLPYFTGNFIDESHFWFGQSWLESIYMGILPLLFVFTAVLFIRKNHLVIFFTSIILIFLILSLGRLLPIYELLYKYLPGFSMIRYPVKFFSFAAFGCSILAGFGYDYFRGQTLKIEFKNKFYFQGLTPLILFPFLKKIYFPDATDLQIDTWANSIFLNFIIVCLIIISCILLISLLFKNKIPISAFNFGIVSFVILDLFLFGSRINPFVPQKIYGYKSEGLRFILQDRDFYRILLEPKSEKYFHIIRGATLEEALINVQQSLVPNSGLFYKIFDAEGYESLTLNDYNHVLELIKKEGRLNLLDLLNVKYLISKFELKMPHLKLVYEDAAIKIYQNMTCLPRAFFVSKIRVIENRAKILEVMNRLNFNPMREVIIEEGIQHKSKILPCNNLRIQNPKSKIKIIDYQPNKIILEASSKGNCLLFLSDTYYPGWQAYIDGKLTKIYRANYAFRAISFPAGNHKVEFIYFPFSFLVGIIGSIVSGFISATLLMTTFVVKPSK